MAGPNEYEYSDNLLHSYASICYNESYEFECVPSSTDAEPESPLQFTPENICEQSVSHDRCKVGDTVTGRICSVGSPTCQLTQSTCARDR